MSSDTSMITILRKDGPLIDLRVRSTGADGFNSCCVTRGFALHVLTEARSRARMEPGQRDIVQAKPSLIETQASRHPACADDLMAWWSVDFLRKHVAEFVASTEVLERRNITKVSDEDDEFFERMEQLEDDVEARVDAGELSPRQAEDRRCELYHYLVLRVRMADPQWLDGIEPGWVFGADATDLWRDDPLRPALPAS
jgi:hypothetical protein